MNKTCKLGRLNMKRVFIDGSAGTTGLQIYSRLSKRDDIELLTLPESERKSVSARKRLLNSCDIAFLCLPDKAAVEAVELVENPEVVIIDASTAHRTAPGWVDGFPELSEEQGELIAGSKRIANPGCHASGFIALVSPLIRDGLLDRDAMLSCFSLTGYSGGGKSMIQEYEDKDGSSLHAPRMYGLTQNHKHLNEMRKICGLESYPVFCPVVCDFYSGMQVTVPLHSSQLAGKASIEDIIKCYKSAYDRDPVIKYAELTDHGGMISASSMSGKDGMLVAVYGNEDRIILASSYDNLGKGASGAAIENMNIALGLDRDYGLFV